MRKAPLAAKNNQRGKAFFSLGGERGLALALPKRANTEFHAAWQEQGCPGCQAVQCHAACLVCVCARGE